MLRGNPIKSVENQLISSNWSLLRGAAKYARRFVLTDGKTRLAENGAGTGTGTLAGTEAGAGTVAGCEWQFIMRQSWRRRVCCNLLSDWSQRAAHCHVAHCDG